MIIININFLLPEYLYTIKRNGYEKKEIALISRQILSTNTVGKCMEISVENLYADNNGA